MLNRTILGLLMATLISTGVVAKSPYVECAIRTGQNASVFIRTDVSPTLNGAVLEEGDEIVILDRNDVCAGKAVWTGETVSITVWGDDEMTDVIDGLQVGDPLRFVVYDVSAGMVFGTKDAEVAVGFDSDFPFDDEGVYRPDALFNVTALDISGDPVVPPPTAGVADSFTLGAPYPNPFNPFTTFELEIAEPQEVAVHVYNTIGQQVSMLHEGLLQAGLRHRFQFEGSDLSSGIYLIRVYGEFFVAARSVVLLK